MTRHWLQLARTTGGGVWGEMAVMVERLEPALAVVESRLPADFPDRVWLSVADGARRYAMAFLRNA